MPPHLDPQNNDQVSDSLGPVQRVPSALIDAATGLPKNPALSLPTLQIGGGMNNDELDEQHTADIAALLQKVTETMQNVMSNDSDLAINLANISQLMLAVTSNDDDIATNLTNINNALTAIANNDIDIAQIMADRVLRTGDISTGPQQVPNGTSAVPGLKVGGNGAGLTATTTGDRLSLIANNKIIGDALDSASFNYLRALGYNDKRGALIAYNDFAINANYWAITPKGDAVEPSFWTAPSHNGRAGQVLGNTSLTKGVTTATSSTQLQWEIGARALLEGQGNNLIFNGTGWVGDLTNIVSSTAANVLTFADDQSFQVDGQISSSIFFTDSVAIDPDLPLRFRGKVKGTGGRVYFGIRFEDANNEVIDYHNHTYFADSLTELTQPFSSGDTVMHVADASGWLETVTSFVRGGIAFSPIGGYIKGAVVQPVDGTTQYSWNVFTSDGAGGGYTVDTVANTINFESPVTRADYFDESGVWPVGTTVRQPITRGPYRYSLVNYLVTPEYLDSDFTYAPNVAGSTGGIPKGARFARPMMLCLRNAEGVDITQNFKDFRLTQGV